MKIKGNTSFSVNGLLSKERFFLQMKETDICTFIIATARWMMKGNSWNKR